MIGFASGILLVRRLDPVTLLLSEDVVSRAGDVSRTWQQLAPK
ncbi:MAG: hypothetical protein ACR2ID_12330 [Chthoniobacterales bacterium]